MDKPTIQDVFEKFYPAYLERYSPSSAQTKTARNIINCKTGAYGANISVCEDCGAVHIHYNSCRNRCCPMCQAVPKEMWMDARRQDVLDAPYFHLVFTVPDTLNPVIYSNQKLLYDTLYHAASDTIRELSADTKYQGTVTFSVKDYRNEGRWKELTLPGVEFVRRFLMHVPPKRFVRIRHYGLLCSRTKNKQLTLCRNLLGCRKYLSELKDMEMPEILDIFTESKYTYAGNAADILGNRKYRYPDGAEKNHIIHFFRKPFT